MHSRSATPISTPKYVAAGVSLNSTKNVDADLLSPLRKPEVIKAIKYVLVY